VTWSVRNSTKMGANPRKNTQRRRCVCASDINGGNSQVGRKKKSFPISRYPRAAGRSLSRRGSSKRRATAVWNRGWHPLPCDTAQILMKKTASLDMYIYKGRRSRMASWTDGRCARVMDNARWRM
jgi:hypothetical protein